MDNQTKLLINKAINYSVKGDLVNASKYYRAALEFDLENFDILQNLGIICFQLGNLNESISFLLKAQNLQKDNPTLNYNLATILMLQNNNLDAIKFYENAIKSKSEDYWVNLNYGVCLSRLMKFEEAIIFFKKAVVLNSNISEGWNNLGNVNKELKNYKEALNNFDKAIDINPQYAEAWSNKGITLNDLKRYEEALICLDKAIDINPQYAGAWSNRGITLNDIGKFEDAITNHDKAILLDGNNAKFYFNKAVTLNNLKNYEESILLYEKAYSLNPKLDFLLGSLMHAKIYICDWSDFDKNIDILINKFKNNEKAAIPFHISSLIDSLDINLRAAKIYTKDFDNGINYFKNFSKNKESKKIKIGYFSADFYNHATCHLMAKLFEIHDKNIFEIYAISYGPDKNDEMYQRVFKSFDKFIDVKHKSDADIVKISRDLKIDIAIDLKGYTQFGRPEIFSNRAAPVQINYLGYPGTLGATYIDYIIADTVLIPSSYRDFYSEKIIYLPNTYQVNDNSKKIPKKIFTRSEFGLPNDKFIFCCFNNNYKILPRVFNIWMRILQKVPDSVLWLLEDNNYATKNLLKEASNQGIFSDRIFFAKRMKAEDHLARQALADLFIDTLPLNAHTTASDALWAGLPLLTCLGESFAARVSASLLTSIGLPELITKNLNEYEEKAIYLGKNKNEIIKLKKIISDNRLKKPLFNTELFTKNIEDAYIKAYERFIDNKPLDNIYIK